MLEIFVIFLLLIGNGVFAMAEIAVVSARKARLKKLADDGSVKAQVALELAENPTPFLSTVQIGITLVGVLAGTFGGATISAQLEAYLERIPALAPYADALSLFVVVSAITYFSLLIGELIPKRIALADPESSAMLLARPMRGLSRIARPFVWVLTVSTEVVLKGFGLASAKESPPTEEEISILIEQGTSAGVFHEAEQAMVESVLKLDDRRVTELMTRRTKIVWLDVEAPDEVNWRKIVSSGHSKFPVFEGFRDNVIGMVSVKALWANASAGLPNNLRIHLTPPLFVPESINAVQLLETFKKSGKHIALVVDEFGVVQGIVSLIDVMEAIVGDLPEPGDRSEPEAIRRPDGTWLVDAAMGLSDLRRHIHLPELPREDEGEFETLAGFILNQFGRIPKAAEWFKWSDWTFEVMDMDGNRVDKILITLPRDQQEKRIEAPELLSS